MDSFDILLLVIYGVICYAVGRVSMMNSIVNAVITEAGEEQSRGNKSNSEDLFVEKIDDMYYAYIGGQFVGQNSNLGELFHNMKSIYKVETFKVKNIDGLTKEDHRKIAEAISKNYDLK